jgi:UPF0176 protein
MNEIVISTFYQFFNFPNYVEEKEPLLDFCKSHSLKGTILIASEGMNSTISGTRTAIDQLYSHLRDHLQIRNLEYKESFADFQPFLRMKVRLKKEIVTMGVNLGDVNVSKGEYIEAEGWDEFIAKDEVILIDTRNNYEVELGNFTGSVNPKTKTFRDFPKWVEQNLEIHKDKKVAMYCTGGIRCEKSTAYLKKQGFNQVYHLKGGILKYLEDTHNRNNKWQGSCFVFDDRIAVNNDLAPSPRTLCKHCNNLITTNDLKALQGQWADSCYSCSKN